MEFRIINGEKIKEQRLRKGLSLRQVAALSGNAFTHAAYRRWETGKIRPTDEKIPILMSIFNCQYEDISAPMAIKK